MPQTVLRSLNPVSLRHATRGFTRFGGRKIAYLQLAQSCLFGAPRRRMPILSRRTPANHDAFSAGAVFGQIVQSSPFAGCAADLKSPTFLEA
jgi:hypothetical protein